MTTEEHKGASPDPLNAWEFADEKIRDLQARIKRAERRGGRGNIAVMRTMLDKWLEYRQAHGPNEQRLPL